MNDEQRDEILTEIRLDVRELKTSSRAFHKAATEKLAVLFDCKQHHEDRIRELENDNNRRGGGASSRWLAWGVVAVVANLIIGAAAIIVAVAK